MTRYQREGAEPHESGKKHKRQTVVRARRKARALTGRLRRRPTE